MRRLAMAAAMTLLAGCVFSTHPVITPTREVATPDERLTILVLDPAGLEAMRTVARNRPEYRDVDAIVIDFRQSVTEEYCTFLAAWMSMECPRPSLGLTAARNGAPPPERLSFSIGNHLDRRPPGSTDRSLGWVFHLNRNDQLLFVAPTPGAEMALEPEVVVRETPQRVFTGRPPREVRFEALAPLSFVASAAPITLVGPLRPIVEGETVRFAAVENADRDALLAAAARMTRRPVTDIKFAELGDASVDWCPGLPSQIDIVRSSICPAQPLVDPRASAVSDPN